MDLEHVKSYKPAWDEKRVCDGCIAMFEDGDYAAAYFSDWVYNGVSKGPSPVITPQGMYCLNCYEDEIPLPKRGVNEGFLFETVRYDSEDDIYTVDPGEIMKGSPASQGIDWSPVEMIERFFPAPAEPIFKSGATPYSVFVLLYRSGLDLRGFIQGNELQIPDSAAEKARLIISQGVRYNPSWALHAESL